MMMVQLPAKHGPKFEGLDDTSKTFIMADYERHGLRPVYAGDTLVSLRMLQHLGWRIAERAGGNELVFDPPKRVEK